MLDHLKIPAAHLVGLSMGAYSALQVGIQAPKRALSLTLAGVGSGFEKERLQGFRDQAMAHAEEFEKGDRRRGGAGLRHEPGPNSISDQGPARLQGVL